MDMWHMKIEEFKELVDMWALAHPDAGVDFVYPKRRGDKTIYTLADMAGYNVVNKGASKAALIRIVVGDVSMNSKALAELDVKPLRSNDG